MEYSIEDGLAKLASDGDITEQEQEFLLATYEALQAPDSPLTKSASVTGARIKEVILKEVGLGNLMLAGAAAAPVVGMGVGYALNPVREAMRYRNMMQLPNAHPINLSKEQARSFYVPEHDEKDEMSERAIRKAFAILHRYAPEITRTPELAHNFLHENTGHGVEQFITNAVGYARNPVEVNHKREQMADWKRNHIRNTAQGMKVITDTFNPKPAEPTPLTQAERMEEIRQTEYYKALGRSQANPNGGRSGGGGGGGSFSGGGSRTPSPRMGPSAGGAIAAGILGNRMRSRQGGRPAPGVPVVVPVLPGLKIVQGPLSATIQAQVNQGIAGKQGGKP